MVDENLPRRFGKYTLIRHLATGGMAEIYLAIHKSIQGFEKIVVIKRILPRFSEDEEFIRMFLAEARIAATLNHPNIIQIFDVGSVGRDYFIAMEYVHGEDLRSIVGGMRQKGFKEFPLEMALGITRGVLQGLGYAHEHKGLDGEPLNIVHRDISPQNLIVTFTGEVKLVDFGIARAVMKDMKSDKDGALRGKFPYMSPEQCRGQDLDRRSDIFSVAIVLFELTVGRRLFKGKNEIETIRRIVELPFPKPTDTRPDYPPELERIVMKGLARGRDQRYRDAREMLEDIEEYIRDRQIKVTSLDMTRFMESLFEEKLATQREQMKEGKKLADIVAEQEVEQVGDEDFLDLSGLSHSAGTPAGRTTEASAVTAQQQRRRTSPAIFVVLGVLLLVLGGLGAFVGVTIHKSRSDAASRVGVVEVSSNPSGAAVWMDGEKRPGATPVSLDKLKVDIEYTIKVTKEGYEPFEKTVKLTRKAPRAAIEAKLAVIAPVGDGVLKIVTKPSDADIILDGKKLDERGSVTVSGLAPGVPHRLLVADPEYKDYGKTVTLKAGEVTTVEVVLEPRPLGADEFMLTITTEPGGASVFVDGEKLEGITPLEKRLPWKKNVEVVVELAKHKKETVKASPEAGKSLALTFKLEKRKVDSGGGSGEEDTSGGGSGPGKLVLDSQPWANVNIPGVGKFVTPFTTSLPAGTYKVSLSNPGGLSKTITIKVGAGETVRKKVEL